MAFMKPETVFMVAYVCETTHGVECVPDDVCGGLTCDESGEVAESALPDLAECVGGEVVSATRKQGWYARLSASGYLDCTEWEGPYATETVALATICELFDIDENGADH